MSAPLIASLFHGKQLNRTPAFANRFIFSPQAQRRLSQARIEHQHHQGVANQFLLLDSRRSKSGTCFGIVFCHPGDKTFQKRRAVFATSFQTLFSPNAAIALAAAGSVTLCQCAVKPAVTDPLECSRIFYPYLIDHLMKGSGICFPIEFHEGAPDLRVCIIRLDG